MSEKDRTMDNINFDETKQSQLPLVEMLINLGYRYISRADVFKERGLNNSRFILRETAFKKFSEINSYEHQGQTYKFSDTDIVDVINELEDIPFEGLVDTSKKIYSMIMPTTGGKTITVFQGGSRVSKSFKYIDFENIENNDFSVTVEFDASGKSNIRVDIVLFVNGIPFAIIENKKSSESVELAISQNNRNQSPTHCPKLYIYPQLLIGANKEEFKYGTIGTPNKFYAKWRERELVEEEWKNRESFDIEFTNKVKEVIAKPINPAIYKTLLEDLNGYTYNHSQHLNRVPTQQDHSVLGMLTKERLLDISKNFILYDAGVKKVMRYQQFFAIKKMLNRISQKEILSTGERRQGGILWQTQGSGKSLTMVMFVKALIENPDIVNPRVIIVTDRKDLDRQIRDTFKGSGLKKDVKQATSGEDLLNLIKHKDLRVITTLVHKFQSASTKRADFVDKDQNIFVLIDEAHRSQSGEANIEMNRVIPNASYIAFTGTPLLKEDKSKLKFGSFIDKYTIDDALEDEIILPLIYEGRYVDLRQDTKEIDKQTDRLAVRVEDRKRLQTYIKLEILKDNPQRINEIAFDIQKHYLSQFAGSGLKAQIVAPSKYSATLFQKFFKDQGKINTALVISDENGIITEEDDRKKEVEEYLRDIKENYQSLLSYEKEVIESFKYNEDGVEILIVVDKLLTGFDAPRNTVLYLAKQLKDHNLLQAIARVNRLYDNDRLPKTAGYIIDYSENALNLKTAMQLFGNYDEEDVKTALIDVHEKVEELEKSYSALHDQFNGIQKDDEAYLQFLSDEATRKQFYELLNNFLKNFSECMVMQKFVHEFDHIDTYRNELKKFLNLRKTASVRYAEDVDFSKFKYALIKIMDSNIKAEEAELLTKQISINDKDAFEEVLAGLGSDASKAEAIAAQVNKVTTENLDTDPEYYHRFSLKISKLLQEMREKKISDIEALKQAKLLQEQILSKRDDTIPDAVKVVRGADIIYRNLKEDFNNYSLQPNEFVNVATNIMKTLDSHSRVDWHLNSESIRVMANAVDDYLYDEVRVRMGVNLTSEDIRRIVKKTIELALNNHEVI